MTNNLAIDDSIIVERKREIITQKDNLKILNSAEINWNKCLDIIKDNVPSQAFNTFFSKLKVKSQEEDKLTIYTPNQFFIEWIEDQYYDLLNNTIKQVIGKNASIQYEIVVDKADKDDNLKNRKSLKVKGLKYPPPANQTAITFKKDETQEVPFISNLNPRYAFENYVTGDSNQLASSAAHAVAQNPGGTRFNPLVIYGGVGLGKTHLAQAIGNHILQNNSKLKVLYTNSERFYMDFINAISKNKASEFVNYYRSVDVLIVDDIQFFTGKEKTQENFFHTFNALNQSGKQVILTSDKPPRELQDVDERLISRFSMGLTVDIQQPDLEMRMAILQKKSLDEGIEIPYDILEYLAKHIKTSIRELEGVLISLIAKVTLDNKPLSIDLAKELIIGITNDPNRPVTIDEIKQKVSDYYKISIEDIESKVRKHEIALARQMAMYLSRELTRSSLKTIGANFSKRDHSTVLHSCQTIENYFDTDKTVKLAYDTLLRQLKREG